MRVTRVAMMRVVAVRVIVVGVVRPIVAIVLCVSGHVSISSVSCRSPVL